MRRDQRFGALYLLGDRIVIGKVSPEFGRRSISVHLGPFLYVQAASSPKRTIGLRHCGMRITF